MSRKVNIEVYNRSMDTQYISVDGQDLILNPKQRSTLSVTAAEKAEVDKNRNLSVRTVK